MNQQAGRILLAGLFNTPVNIIGSGGVDGCVNANSNHLLGKQPGRYAA